MNQYKEYHKLAAKAAVIKRIDKATELKRTAKGPEPERLKISGYKNWEDAISPILGKRRPPGGWAK
jgi:hypothetical protein